MSNKKEKNLSNKIFDAIKKEDIKPKPRWEFLLKDYFILAAGILSVLVGGLAVAVIIFMVINNNWDLLPFFNRTRLGHFFIILPYYWLLFLSIFILLTYYYIKHTKKGYRYSLQIVTLISVGTSIILGVFFYSIGFGRTIDDVFSRRMPIYRNVAHKIPKNFIMPENGILAGEIVEINNDNFFIILDIKNDRWKISLDSLKQKCTPNVDLGIKIIIMGEDAGENNFNAFGLRPWDREDMFHQIEECGELFYEDMMNLRELMTEKGFHSGIDSEVMHKGMMRGMKENY